MFMAFREVDQMKKLDVFQRISQGMSWVWFNKGLLLDVAAGWLAVSLYQLGKWQGFMEIMSLSISLTCVIEKYTVM